MPNLFIYIFRALWFLFYKNFLLFFFFFLVQSHIRGMVVRYSANRNIFQQNVWHVNNTKKKVCEVLMKSLPFNFDRLTSVTFYKKISLYQHDITKWSIHFRMRQRNMHEIFDFTQIKPLIYHRKYQIIVILWWRKEKYVFVNKRNPNEYYKRNKVVLQNCWYGENCFDWSPYLRLTLSIVAEMCCVFLFLVICIRLVSIFICIRLVSKELASKCGVKWIPAK